MRDFKYRAWIKPFATYKGELVQGRMCKVHSIHFGTKRAIITSEGYGNVSVEFDRIILEEYTGLPDKNGVEIYEGDIVRHGYTRQYGDGETAEFFNNFPVSFSNNYGGWIIGAFNILTTKNIKNYNIEVIGNIHDNPELLEKTE